MPDTPEEAAIRAKIHKDANPEPDQHVYGQPLRPEIDDRGQQRSKHYTDCKKEHSASLRCIEENYEKRELCQKFFDDYKKCRKEERERRLEENAKKTGGGAWSSWW